MKRRFLLRGLVYLFVSVLFVLTVFPIIYSLLASFKTNSEIVANGARDVFGGGEGEVIANGVGECLEGARGAREDE